ncbi:hypothetical protein C8Q75DRAFT_335082 [Abortiporus biennis]|nr:hypothetical protein C8Q75DRAFT_335082 [Abortiporus biennis]
MHSANQEILRLFRYDERGTVLLSNYDIFFDNGGKSEHQARADIGLIQLSSHTTFLVVAAAIAAFQYSNLLRQNFSHGLPVLDKMVIPAIYMYGTRPHFFKIPVTKELCDAVEKGEFPVEETVVSSFRLPFHYYFWDGINEPEVRRNMFKYLEAFREIAKDCRKEHMWHNYWFD